MSNTISSNRISFLDLIQKHQITIPIIQRDYVQGRDNSEVNEIRKIFLQEILTATTSNQVEGINLGFIYGKVLDKDFVEIKKKNKEAIEGILSSLQDYTKHLDEELVFSLDWKDIVSEPQFISHSRFIPLDGQQRLTTLFLFHWYILHQTKEKENHKVLLNSFSYSTRKKTQEFLKAIIKYDFDLSEKLFGHQIIMKTWFQHQWLQDPSVLSMINTLNDFHELLQGENLKNIWQRLGNQVVTFDYLDLDQLQQTDDIYVKMNARGKQISDFEHFKAWLQAHVKNTEISLEFPNWADKLDIQWLDLFWFENDASTTDESMLKFFQHIGFSRFLTRKNRTSGKYYYNKIKSLKYEDRFLSVEDNIQLFTSSELEHIFSVLEFLNNPIVSEYQKSINKVLSGRDYSLKRVLLNGKNLENLSLNDELIFHGIILYALKSRELDFSFNSKNFEQWIRIIRNLAANTFIQSYEEFKGTIVSLHKLAHNCFDIEKRLTDPDFTIKSFFGDQVKEEKLKAEKIRSSEAWRNAILKFENHPYFNGQIGFFFDMLEPEEKDDIEKFCLYGDRLFYIFSDVFDKSYSTFQAALLSRTDYTRKVKGKLSFLVKQHSDLRTKFDNWRKIFKKEETSSNGEYPFFALKGIVRDTRTIEEIKNQAEIDDWRYVFVKNKALIEFCSQSFFAFFSETDIHLFRGSTFTGKSVDAYLFFVYKMISKHCKTLQIEKLEGINKRKTIDNYSKMVTVLKDQKTFLKLSYHPEKNIVQWKLEIEKEKTSDFTDRVERIIQEYFKFKTSQSYNIQIQTDTFLNYQQDMYENILNCFKEVEKLEI
jgi:hypothetical protein